MGVHGLWRLIEPSGKPVPLETLENKVLAVDISIWLHQAVKGFQDSKGSSLPNAHLLGIFHRLCKLLYFRIKPVFVFDGGVPVLKKQTIAKRNQLKSKNINDANRIQKQLISTLLKHSAVNKVMIENVKTNLENAKKSTDIFELPPSQFDTISSSSDSESETSFETTESSSPTKTWDLHTIDEKSSHFKNLPADVRHEILTELKETRKQNSWGRIHELPTKSDDFSGYQMKRLLKRYSIQVSLEEAEKEMGGASLSLGELENLLKDHGVISTKDVGSRIASDENKRYFLIKNMKRALEEAKMNKEGIEEKDNDYINEESPMCIEEDENKDLEKAIQLSLQDVPSTSKLNSHSLQKKTQELTEEQIGTHKTIADMEYEQDLQKAIQLSMQEGPSSNDSSFNNYVDNGLFISDEEDNSSNSDIENVALTLSDKVLASAKNYMVEYSGLTPSEISKIIAGENPKKSVDITDKLQAETKKDDDKLQDKFNDFKKPQLSKLTLKASVLEPSKIITPKDKAVTESTPNSNLKLTDECNVEIIEKNINVNNCVNKVNNINDNNLESEAVELISDNSDSDSDFLEVNSKTDVEDTKTTFEIEIRKDAKLNDSDDIFSDIFSDIKENDVPGKLKHGSIDGSESTMSTRKENVVEISATETENVPSNKGNDSQLLNEILKTANVENASHLSTKELINLEMQLNTEKTELLAKQSLKERLANNITEQMRIETQELLRLFGVPYIVAPMEAEAQCAFLDEINLTDGTITDDSDVWLFGGKTVYKNFFNQSKRVLEYKAENIQYSFKMSRYEMILLALLVGSDYTTGVQGVGPVTALEILAHFPIKKQNDLILSQEQLISGLLEFKRWIKGEYNLKGRATLRNKLKNIVLTDQFPSLQVANAYLEPCVESSEENFTWGKPDMVSLIDYAKEKFGWNQKKSEGILKPVFKSLEKNNVQSKITNYFKTKHKIEGAQADEKMSKRVKTAVSKIGKSSISSDEDTTKIKESKPRKRRTKAVKNNNSKPEKNSSQSSSNQKEESPSLVMDDDLKILQQTKKVSRKRAKQIENELRYELEQKELAAANPKIEDPKTILKRKLHSKEIIPQKQKEKADMFRTKMKAIETFRKSKRGPGYVKKRTKKENLPKDDANLSEDSDS